MLFAVIFFTMMDTHVMPFGCPACYHGDDENIAGERRGWYVRLEGDRARCRWCGTYFKEHPDGSLVEDR